MRCDAMRCDTRGDGPTSDQTRRVDWRRDVIPYQAEVLAVSAVLAQAVQNSADHSIRTPGRPPSHSRATRTTTTRAATSASSLICESSTLPSGTPSSRPAGSGPSRSRSTSIRATMACTSWSGNTARATCERRSIYSRRPPHHSTSSGRATAQLGFVARKPELTSRSEKNVRVPSRPRFGDI